MNSKSFKRNLVLWGLAVAISTSSAVAQVNNLLVSSTNMAFTATTGSIVPQAQLLSVSSSAQSLAVNTGIRYLSATDGWLSISAATGNTPFTLTITTNPTNIPAGNHIAQITLIGGATQSTLVNVTLSITGASIPNGVLTAIPSSLALASDTNVVVQSTISINATTPTNFNVQTSTSNGRNWLSTGTTFGTAPTSITILANPVGLTAAVYSGTVTLIPVSGGASLSIPVTFTVGSLAVPNLVVSPPSANFAYQIGTSAPAPQQVLVTYTSAIVTYLATASQPWVKLTSNTSNIPAQSVSGSTNTYLNIAADPTGLSPGVYNATISVSAANAAIQTITLTFSVSTSTLLVSAPTTLSFLYFPGGVNPASQLITVSTTGSPLAYTVGATSSGWLLAGPQNGSTNGNNQITVSVNPGGLSNGTYSGTVTITSGSTSMIVPVSLTVGSTNFSGTVASPPSLSFLSQAGGIATSQTLTLSGLTPLNFFATATSSGLGWLQVNPISGTTPATLTATATPLVNLPPGTYLGSIVITNLLDSSQLIIPVTYTITGGTISSSQQSLVFSQLAGGLPPISQSIQVASSTVSALNITSSATWLLVNPTATNAPTSITVNINASGLGVGTYQAFVTITAASNTLNIPVTLNVFTGAIPTLSTTNISFNTNTGAGAPPPQSIAVANVSSSVAFTAIAQTFTGGNWLFISSNSNITPAILTVSVAPTGLPPGIYRGTITVTPNGGTDSRSAEVLLTVAALASPTIQTVVHSASLQPTFMAPGLIVTLTGNAMGPASGVSGTITGAGAVDTTVSGVRVLFDGLPAPLLYVRNNQINAIAPYGIYGRVSTRIQVEVAGVRSEALDFRVADAAPGLFTTTGAGIGQAAALNQDGTLNSPSNAASSFDAVVLFATGEGQTFAGGQDGRIIATDIRKPLLPVTATVGGVPVEVLYAGSAPGLVSGALQVNLKLNSQVPQGPAVPVVIRIGNATSQSATTIAVR